MNNYLARRGLILCMGALQEDRGKWPGASLLALVCLLGLGGCQTSSSGAGSFDAGPNCRLTQADLQAAPDGGAAPCTFLLGTPPADKSNSSILVYIDGAQVAHDPTDTSGWDYADATQTAIRFFGPVCSEIESGVAQHVTVTYPCLI